ncbi:MAG TPA: hypothetical protein VF240_03785 [Pyrinomonadaceae bacterium]
MKHTPNECYIDVWREAGFKGETRRLHGPASHPHLHFREGDWADDIGSLRLGPHAFVLAFREENYADAMLTLGPNDEVYDMRALKFDNEIESLRLINSLKIFDHLHENVGDTAITTTHAPDAGRAESSAEQSQGQQKTRGRGKNTRR